MAGRLPVEAQHEERPVPGAAAVSGARASVSSCTQNSSRNAFSKKNRRHAVPFPGCTFAGPSAKPAARSTSASGAPTAVQTKT